MLTAALGLPEAQGAEWVARLRADHAQGAVADVPRHLPAAVGHFTGRQAELDALTGLADADSTGGTVVICAIDGMAGIGKTALAIHAAHRLAGAYPDGQLFLDLYGYTQGQAPRTAEQALEWLLRALGVPAERIPADGEQAAALYRQRLADTRTLIVLDNAVDESQVRPLLPAAGGCVVLVTSRRRLKGLDDGYSVSLDVLAHAEGVALLRAVAGSDRVPDGDPRAGEVAGLCGHLPLALRIAGALLRHRPAWDLEHLAGLLREQHQRLRALSDGDRDLGTVFDLSYQSLRADTQRVFRSLGLVPGPDLDAHAAATLTEADSATATRMLEELVDQNLLICHVPGRYRMHDLIRAHARTLAAADPAPGRDAALERLLGYYAHTAHRASIPLARYPRPAPDGPAPAHGPALPDLEAAWAWLRAERDSLEAAHTHARAHDLHEHSLALAAGLAQILRADGPYTRALEVHQAAADTAERLGSPTAQANALIELGRVRRLTGDLAGAGEAFSRALEIHRATGSRQGEADALIELGIVRLMTEDLAGAGDAYRRALEINRATGYRRGEATALAELGIVQYTTGDLPEARDSLSQALEIYRTTGHRVGQANALTYLGNVRMMTGDLPGAADAFSRALQTYRAINLRTDEAYTLTRLGTVQRMAGNLPEARNSLTRALEICHATGHRPGEASALAELGIVRRLAGDLPGAGDALSQAMEIFRATGIRNDEAWALNHYAAVVAAGGDLPRALALYQQALSMNREQNTPDDEALSLEGLGECHLAGGHTQTAATHLRQALEIYQRLGMTPDTRRLQDRLNGLATP